MTTNDKTGIGNLALINLGQGTINDLDNPTTNAGSILNVFYDDARQFALRAGAWRFALYYDEISRENTAPKHSWSYQFALPTRCMLLHQIGTDENRLKVNRDYKIVGRKVFTNEEGPMPVVYVDNIEDVSIMPPDFKFAMAAYLAHLGAPEILKSTDKAKEMLDLFNFYMEQAANNSALENPPEIIKESKWLGAQRSLGRARIY